MHSIFGVPWGELDREHVTAFLQTADEETVLWEAKGEQGADGRPAERLRALSIAKEACAFANQLGGYLIIGASRPKGGNWTAGGIEPRGEEPCTWISSVLTDNLRPVPRFDARGWTLDGGRWLIVVRVEPIDQPPCMTNLGAIYERVSSESRPITDPGRLAELIGRGEQARRQAERFADGAAKRAIDDTTWDEARCAAVALALAPVGRVTDDIASRLFSSTFRMALTDALERFTRRQQPPSGGGDPRGASLYAHQDALVALAHFDLPRTGASVGELVQREPHSSWQLQVTWDGAVAASVHLAPDALNGAHAWAAWEEFEEIVRPAWREAATLVELLGGYGAARLTMMTYRGRFENTTPPRPPSGTMFSKLHPEVWLRRWTEVREPADEEVDSLDRELRRAAGQVVDEPEPAA